MIEDVVIWSEGVKMAGQLYAPDDFSTESRHPVVVSCHGWSAPLMEQMRTTMYGEDLAASGYCLLIFDYRGWGASDSSVIAPRPPDTDSASVSRGEVRPLEGVLDPFAWATDVIHAIDFIATHPGIAQDRIGLLGSSVGGGIAVHVASRDPRVKCVVSQMGVQDLRGSDHLGYSDGLPFWTTADMSSRAARAAREGELPQSIDVPDLIVQSMGHAPGVRLSTLIHPDVRRWAPINDTSALTVPTLILDAGDEPNWDIRLHGERLSHNIQRAGHAHCEYRVIPDAGHVMETYSLMGMAGSAESAMREAGVDWFTRHL